jgi:hypothetical protein
MTIKTYSIDELEAVNVNNVAPENSRVKSYSIDELDNISDWDNAGKGLLGMAEKAVKNYGLGFASDVAQLPSTMGNLLVEDGEKKGAGLAIPGLRDGVSLIENLTKENLMGSPIDPMVVNLGKKINQNNQRLMEVMKLHPTDGSKFAKVSFDIGAGTSSALQSIGLYMAFKQPALIFGMFGARAKAGFYEEAREAGKEPLEASALSSAVGAFEGGIAAVMTTAFMKAVSYDNVAVRTMIRGGIEGLEEALQQTSEEAIAKMSGVRNDQWKEVISRIGYSALIGTIVGAKIGGVMSTIERSAVKRQITDLGFNDKEASAIIKHVSEKTMENKELFVAVEKAIDEDMAKTEKRLMQFLPEDVKKSLNEKQGEQVATEEELESGELKKKEESEARVSATIQRLDALREELGLREGALEGAKDTMEVASRIKEATAETQAKLDKAKTEKTKSKYQDILDEQKAQIELLTAEAKETKESARDVKPISRIQTLRQRVQDIETGIKEGRKDMASDTKAVQEELIDLLNTSELEDKNKAKFISKIKNINTPEKFMKNALAFEQAIKELEARQEIKELKAQFKKQVKSIKKALIQETGVKDRKFDIETNRVLKDFLGILDLTQEEASARLTALGDSETELDLFQSRVLSLIASGGDASPNLYRSVLRDIATIKESGKEIKSQQDIENILARHDFFETAKQKVESRVGSKDKIGGKVIDFYLRGLGDIDSLVSAVFGTKISSTLNPKFAETQKDVALFSRFKQDIAKMKDVLGLQNDSILFDKINEMAKKDHSLVSRDGARIEISLMDILDIYLSLKNKVTQKRYFEFYGEDQVISLVNNLSQEQKMLGEYMQGNLPQYFQYYNEYNIQRKGVDLKPREEYWPASSEREQDFFDDMKFQSKDPSAIKRLKLGSVIPTPKNAYHKYIRYVTVAEHINNLSPYYTELKNLVNDRRVKHAIINKFGENLWKNLDSKIENLSFSKVNEEISSVEDLMGKAINNWVIAKIGMNPSVFLKQLVSVVNYTETMGTQEWGVKFFQGLSTPKKTLDFMFENVPYLKTRFEKGYDEMLSRALSDSPKLSKWKHNWVMAMSTLTRMGDVGAIIFGGYPYLKSMMDKKGVSKPTPAMVKDFVETTVRSQQFGGATGLADFQINKHPIMRVFTAFTNTPNQYSRISADAMIKYLNGEISQEQLAKTVIIYQFINPVLFSSMGLLWGALLSGGFEDDDWKDIALQLIVNPVSGLPVIKDLANYATRQFLLKKKTMRVIGLSLFSDIEMGMKKLSKKPENITFLDIVEGLAFVPEAGAGIPVSTATRITKGLAKYAGIDLDNKKKKTKSKRNL